MAQILGLDITDTAVRGMLLRTALRKIEPQRYVQAPLTLLPGQAGRAAELRDAVQSILAQLDRHPDTVICALHGHRASVRTLEIPTAAAKRAHEVIPFELEPMLPFEIEEAVVDYQPIDTTDGQMRLMVAAMLKEHVRESLHELQGAGIEPRELGVGAVSLDGLVGLAPQLWDEECVALVHIDQHFTDVCMLERGHATLGRTLSVGAADFGKRGEDLWRGIHRTLASHRAAGGSPASRLLVGGPGATAEGVFPWLSDHLHLDTEPAPLPVLPGADETTLPIYLRAAALAGRAAAPGKRIDLRRGEFAPPKATNALRRHAPLLAACLTAVVLSGLFSIFARRAVLEDQREMLRARLESVTQGVFDQPVSDPELVQTLLGGGLRKADPLPRFEGLDAVQAVSDAVPEEVIHDVRRMRVEIGDRRDEGRLELQGILGSIEERDKVASNLEAHECFHEIDSGRTTPASGEDRIIYRIEAVIRCPDQAGSSSSQKRNGRRDRDG